MVVNNQGKTGLKLNWNESEFRVSRFPPKDGALFQLSHVHNFEGFGNKQTTENPFEIKLLCQADLLTKGLTDGYSLPSNLLKKFKF
jgi:hypothetical protein